MADDGKSDRLATLAWIGVIGVASLTLVGAREVEDRIVARRQRRRRGLSDPPDVHVRKAKEAIRSMRRSIDEAEASRVCSPKWVDAIVSAERSNWSSLDHIMSSGLSARDDGGLRSDHGAQSGRLPPLRDQLRECVRARGFVPRGGTVN